MTVFWNLLGCTGTLAGFPSTETTVYKSFVSPYSSSKMLESSKSSGWGTCVPRQHLYKIPIINTSAAMGTTIYTHPYRFTSGNKSSADEASGFTDVQPSANSPVLNQYFQQ